MFSKWIESAKDSASQLLNAGKTVLQDVVILFIYLPCSLYNLSKVYLLKVSFPFITWCIVNDKATAYFREKMVKQPEDMTYITPNLIGIFCYSLLL